MCALRSNRALSAVSLAQQYRLDMKPRRPAMRKLHRSRRHSSSSDADLDANVETDEVLELVEEEEDEEFDFDEDEELDLPADNTELSQRYYLMSCRQLGVMPVRSILRGLLHEKLSCKGFVLLPDDAKAATIAILGNTIVETVEFERNEIGENSAHYFGDVFRKNVYLTEIRLRWNGLRTEGARVVCEALEKNNSVRILDLTGNQFNDRDAIYFRDLLDENSAMYELHLSHNYFRERGGEYIADGLAANDFLRVLDLSWNHLRMGGATAIGKALAKNINLEVLNLSWNGMYQEGASQIATSLTRNQALRDLDLSCNRLSEACVATFLAGLKNNSTLKKLRIGRNHISHVGAVLVLDYIKNNPKIGLEYIDMGDQHVRDDFIKLLKELQENRRLEVVFGIVWSCDRDPIGKQDASEDELALLNENPHFVLMEFMRIQKLRLVDLFHQMDKDNSKGISVDEFQNGLREVHIPLKRKTLETFVRKCDTDNNGEIEYSELIEANKLYKEALRKLAKSTTPMEKSAIGRIQKLLRKIMLDNRGLPPDQGNQLATGSTT
ncbi:leucine-rich repeat-containing protein 74A-like [Mya arenaria]|uniref:leucine-rich repeat-containing protein 74A-like n=1 Tax=Mya arenaria TaxID=6604 RepID=UPI0022E84906|nr:leucine-rich repeat-containing protein 74A-like [Mya arenaria]